MGAKTGPAGPARAGEAQDGGAPAPMPLETFELVVEAPAHVADAAALATLHLQAHPDIWTPLAEKIRALLQLSQTQEKLRQYELSHVYALSLTTCIGQAAQRLEAAIDAPKAKSAPDKAAQINTLLAHAMELINLVLEQVRFEVPPKTLLKYREARSRQPRFSSAKFNRNADVHLAELEEAIAEGPFALTTLLVSHAEEGAAARLQSNSPAIVLILKLLTSLPTKANKGKIDAPRLKAALAPLLPPGETLPAAETHDTRLTLSYAWDPRRAHLTQPEPRGVREHVSNGLSRAGLPHKLVLD